MAHQLLCAENMRTRLSPSFKFVVRLHSEYNTILALWKHHVNLLLQSFRSVSSDLHRANNALLALMKIRAYGSKALQFH